LSAATRGEIREFTGIDDPYDAPLQPKITLDTLSQPPEANARRILNYLVREGFVREPDAEKEDRFEPAPHLDCAHGRMIRTTVG
jgi:hypothetical protein